MNHESSDGRILPIIILQCTTVFPNNFLCHKIIYFSRATGERTHYNSRSLNNCTFQPFNPQSISKACEATLNTLSVSLSVVPEVIE